MLTFVIQLATMLNDAGLAIARLVVLVVLVVRHGVVATIVLRRVHVPAVGPVHVHLLHSSGEHRDIIATRRMANILRSSVPVGGIETVVVSVRSGCASRRGHHGSRRRSGRGAGAEGSRTSLESRLNRWVGSSLVTADVGVISRQVAAVATRDSTSRNATKTSIVVMEMLLSMVVGICVSHGRTRRVLSRGDVVRRKGTLQLRRSNHSLGAGRRHDRVVSLNCVFRNVLEVHGVTHGGRSVSKSNDVADLS